MTPETSVEAPVPRGHWPRWAIPAALVLLYGLAGIRWVGQGTGTAVLDSPVFRVKARVLSPGLHFAPPLLLKIYRYPPGPRTLDYRSGEDGAPVLRTAEGAEMTAEARVDYEILPDGGLELHRRLGPDYPSALREELGRSLKRLLAEVRDPLGEGRPEVEAGLRTDLDRVGRESGLRFETVALKRLGAVPPRLAGGEPATRIVVLGLDGADWMILEPALRDGRLPNLKSLYDRGARARLRTQAPVLSPVLWTTIATGKRAEKHGIIDFLAVDSRTGRQVPVTSNLRKVHAIWNIATDAGLTVGITGWWATWPAEQVNGAMVTDRVSYQLFGLDKRQGAPAEGKTWPPGLMAQVAPLVVNPADIPVSEISTYVNLPGGRFPENPDELKRIDDFRRALAAERTYAAIGLRVLEDLKPAFYALYLEGTDSSAHLFMPFRPPRMPHIPEEMVERYGQVVDRMYEDADRVLGEILRRTDPASTTYLVLSDHGFRTGENRPLTDSRVEGGGADWHRKFGVLLMAGPAIREGLEIQEASILDITPTLLALLGLPVGEDMDGRVLREAIREDFLADHPVRTIPSYESGEVSQAAEPIASPEDREIKEKLIALGYVGSSVLDDSSPPASSPGATGIPSAGDLELKNANSYNNRGTLFMNQGRLDDAIREFEEALRLEPRFEGARVNLGVTWMMKGDEKKAEETFLQILRENPRSKGVENLLGNLYMNRKDYRRAEERFRRALDIDPRFTDALNSLGILLDTLGRYDEAVKSYERVVAIDPDYAEGFNNIGNIYKKQNRMQDAIRLYKRAIEADPAWFGSYNNLGLVYQDLGEYDEAIGWYRKALERNPLNADVRNNLATLYHRTGRYDEAVQEYKQLIHDAPRFAEARNNLGALYGEMGQFDEEMEEYRKALEINPDYADARHNLGFAYMRRSQWKEAIPEFREALRLKPVYPSAWQNLGATLLQLRDLRGAEDAFRKGLEQEPQSTNLLNALATVLLEQGKKAEALGLMRRSLALAPNQPVLAAKVRELEGTK